MPLSQSPAIPWIAYLLSAIPIGFGINAMLNPQNALSWFDFPHPLLPQDQELINAILIVYGARDVFMGAALFAAAHYGNDARITGWILILTGAVAGVDGAICPIMEGSLHHWSYGPVVFLFGSVLAAGL
ncbi:related to integral membrane protein [Ramularia collo-cygni]|uniref:Related to integral membrane protein n=1 Tax=Ramularia collo-cygni TaxID=112498 RepID=A0A2D3VKJ9_9PEZI|nr:related to integral membrane protein [Ramularia collo-cygni]CZT25061.1 related to integral membrane protein [Ramularia collo-cygni]